MMKKNYLAAPLICAVSLPPLALSASDNHLPNIIYILMDDMGYGEAGCYGQNLIETPHIDALAASGVLFTQNYAGSGVSAPSRCVTLTGQHTGHACVRGNDEAAGRGDVWNMEAVFADAGLEGQAPMPADTRTIGHMLQEVGYKTAMIGKWGLGYPGSASTPNKMGFDFFYGYNCQRQAHNYYPMFLYRNEKRELLDNAPLLGGNGKLDKDADKYDPASYKKFLRKDYSNDLMFDEVKEFVAENKYKPFFLMWTTPVPHVGLQTPQKWVDYYQKKFNEQEPYTGVRGYFPHRYPHAAYAGVISYFDEQIGQLVAQLKAEGIYDNTVIIFTSDNGPDPAGGTDAEYFDSAAPFKNKSGTTKASLREGGIRAPLIVSWPAQIKEARRSEHICASWDIMPTLAEIAQAKSNDKIDGISFLPELLGQTQKKHSSLYWELGGQRAARMDSWKILATAKGPEELVDIKLYHLDQDIQEEHNLADENPEIKAKMVKILKDSRTQPQKK